MCVSVRLRVSFTLAVCKCASVSFTGSLAGGWAGLRVCVWLSPWFAGLWAGWLAGWVRSSLSVLWCEAGWLACCVRLSCFGVTAWLEGWLRLFFYVSAWLAVCLRGLSPCYAGSFADLCVWASFSLRVQFCTALSVCLSAAFVCIRVSLAGGVAG